MKLTILSNEEQKTEAIRAIVTAQHEIESIIGVGGLRGDKVLGAYNAVVRRSQACEWLSLC